MASRAHDWFDQARRDLKAARHLLAAGDFEWACFAAQQASEKAAKAVYQARGEEARGHTVTDLLQGFEPPIGVDPPLLDMARELDTYYIPTRYPNAHAEGAPYRYYSLLQAERAIGYSETILRFCNDLLPR